MRLFIASPVVLNEYTKIKKNFADIIEGRWVVEENLHLTWVFLGEQHDAAPFLKSLENMRPLLQKITIKGLEYFGRPPRLFYANAQSRVLFHKAQEFKEMGFSMEHFKPHITLCRMKKILDYQAYKEKLKCYKRKEIGIILPKIALYESKLTDRGAIYTQLKKRDG